MVNNNCKTDIPVLKKCEISLATIQTSIAVKINKITIPKLPSYVCDYIYVYYRIYFYNNKNKTVNGYILFKGIKAY